MIKKLKLISKIIAISLVLYYAVAMWTFMIRNPLSNSMVFFMYPKEILTFQKIDKYQFEYRFDNIIKSIEKDR